MKTLFRIFAVLLVLLLIALVSGYFILTNAGFQKSLVERQLPEGSSIGSIHVTTTQVTLSGLILMLEDGTRVEVGTVDTAFEPLAAVFDQTIKMGVLQVEGLRVDLPTVTEPTVAAGLSTAEGEPRLETVPSTPTATESEASTNPMEALNALGNFEWLLDIDGIDFEGVIHDGQGSMYGVQVDSPAIRPGESSTIDASLQLLTDAPLPSGLKVFDSTATLSFKQKAEGGFESLQLELKTLGADAQGRQLISVQAALELEVDDAAGVATTSVTFNADLPKPQVIAPELAILGALQVSGNTVASTDGKKMILSAANLNVSAAGAELLALDLKRSLVFGAEPDLSGELLDITITALQLEWLNPWLPELQVQSEAPISLALSVAGAADGAFMLTFDEPLQLGPLTVAEAAAPLVQDIVVIAAPKLQVRSGQLKYSLNAISVADKYGSFIQGSSSGVIQLDAIRDAANPFAGVLAQTKLQIGLQELFQLPALARSASIVSGQLSLNVNVDAAADEPLRLQAKIKGLRARSMPSVAKDYDLALAVKPTLKLGEWAIGADLLVGSPRRPSTSLQLAVEVNPSQPPMTFSAALSGPHVTQEDLSILSAAFTPREQAISEPTLSRSSAARGTEQPQAARGVGVDGSGTVPPVWAMLDGRATISIDEFRLDAGQVIEAIALKAVVSEPKLMVNPISAKIGEGELKGSSTVLFAASQAKPYSLTADIRFADVNPAFFVKKYRSAPVQGRFDGVFQLTGVGQSLDAAVEDSTATLKISGEEGILTAFEMDERQQLGLGLAGLLGQSLDRPGIAALSRTIPYFKDILFDSFVFELTRGADKRVLIPQLRLMGDSILIDASGSVAPSGLSEIMDQPLNLTLSLGAKGRLTESLETLDLLQPSTAEDGFRRWNKDIQITGSLADPDTGELMDILNDAAKGAFSTSNKRESVPAETDPSQQLSTELVPQADGTGGTAAEPEAPQKKSKQERRRDDIETGLDLINSFFGN